MKQFLNHLSESPARAIHGRSARITCSAGIALLLAAACSEGPGTNPSVPSGGSGGQVAAGTGGTGVTAGTSSMPTGGTPPAVSGAAGTVATGGSAGAGVGGSGGAGGGGGSGGTGGGTAGSGGGGGGDDGFVSLFNGTDLTGWTKGPTGGTLFAVDSTAGEPAIHVYPDATAQKDGSSQQQASLRTNETSYSSYVLHVEYKWGQRRFGDRAGKARDNGICFHIAPPLPTNAEWPTSVEFQLGSQDWPGDWVSGNIFMLVNKTRAQWPNMMTTANGQTQAAYSPTGTKKKIGAPDSYYKALSVPPNLNKGGGESVTTAATEWNIVELTVHGSKDAEYKVNGTVVNGLTDMEVDSGNGTFVPLDHGAIALQAEFAEVYFRNIKIKVLP
jgi:hypothetical protein